MIYGNIEGIKDFTLQQLEKLYEIKLNKGQLISEEIAMFLSDISTKLNKEINLCIDRNGNITEISIGDSSTVTLPFIPVYEKKLSGKRIVHTHPNGNPKLSSVDISALLKLKLDAILAIGCTEETMTGAGLALCCLEGESLHYEEHLYSSIQELEAFPFLETVQKVETDLRRRNIVEDDKEYAILVGIDSKASLEELEELAHACNIEVLGQFFQNRSKADKVLFLGAGKAKELSLFRQIKRANLIIADEELSGLQVKNLEEVTGCKVIDRTTLILEIFARRARSREAKIQVELAQLKYRSNRLIGYGVTMSRLGGGVGSKGPGEKKLEIDRRRIRENISFLKKELENIKKTRSLQREKREHSNIPKLALVGYTNVGKSTLRNLLAANYTPNSHGKEGVFAENMLFATLDTTTRTILLDDNTLLSLTDTVGFIRKLPHDLIEAFKSTLEEVIFSDLILHIVDASSEEALSQMEAVHQVLSELNCQDKKNILVLNKCDMATPEQIQAIREQYPDITAVEISAKEHKNIELLLEEIKKELPQNTKTCSYLIPYHDSSIVAYLHKTAKIQEETYEAEGTFIKAVVNIETENRCKKYEIE
ncbi:GTPase HflX [Fusobacterium necrophorum]|uniref:GTPase HflX n=1 Tax=Fusobacterium necrophorum TaxID=859 RepID=UPI00370F580B